MTELVSVEPLTKLDVSFQFKPDRPGRPVRSYLTSGLKVERNYFPMLLHINYDLFKIEKVENITYLAGKVSINSKNDAISYVRLLTTPFSDSCLSGFLGYEVLLAKNLRSSDWLGFDPGKVNFENISGYMGVISDDDARKISFEPINCEENKLFRIKRYVLEMKNLGHIDLGLNRRADIVILHEQISRDGDYKLIKKSIHKKGVNLINWRGPINI